MEKCTQRISVSLAAGKPHLGHTTRLQIQQKFSRYNNDHYTTDRNELFIQTSVNINNAKLQYSK